MSSHCDPCCIGRVTWSTDPMNGSSYVRPSRGAGLRSVRTHSSNGERRRERGGTREEGCAKTEGGVG